MSERRDFTEGYFSLATVGMVLVLDKLGVGVLQMFGLAIGIMALWLATWLVLIIGQVHRAELGVHWTQIVGQP